MYTKKDISFYYPQGEAQTQIAYILIYYRIYDNYISIKMSFFSLLDWESKRKWLRLVDDKKANLHKILSKILVLLLIY